MKKLITLLSVLVLVFGTSGIVSANTIASSTMWFQGTLVPQGGGVYTATMAMIDEAAAPPAGDNEPGFDVYGAEGELAWFGDDPGTGPEWTSQPISNHDAWPSWDPDTPDWYAYSLRLTVDVFGQARWTLNNHPGATEDHPWNDTPYWGVGGLPAAGRPMSGTIDWTTMIATETDIGSYNFGTGTPEIPGGAASNGGGAGAWDMDWSWGSEVVPLECPNFLVTITVPLPGVNIQRVSLTPYCSVNVSLDIQPKTCPNTLNFKKQGLVPVAILGTADFDVNDIDPSTLELEGVAAISWDIKDVATPFNGVSNDDCFDCTKSGKDGFDDLTVKFEGQEIVAALGGVDDGECVGLTITGETTGGTPISGIDYVIILNK